MSPRGDERPGSPTCKFALKRVNCLTNHLIYCIIKSDLATIITTAAPLEPGTEETMKDIYTAILDQGYGEENAEEFGLTTYVVKVPGATNFDRDVYYVCDNGEQVVCSSVEEATRIVRENLAQE